jgi:hypothetical protein
VSTPYIGIAICHKGVYPEIVRGLTLNGAEIIIRPTLIVNGMGELQNRAHAMFNQVFVVAPNLGPGIRKDSGIQDLFGGQSMIFNARGQIVAQQKGWTSGDSFVRTTIDTPGGGVSGKPHRPGAVPPVGMRRTVDDAHGGVRRSDPGESHQPQLLELGRSRLRVRTRSPPLPCLAACSATNGELLPMGAPDRVEGTALDFREGRRIGDHLPEDGSQPWPGIDHAFVLDEPARPGEVAATLWDPRSGRAMDVITGEPSLQVYTANRLAEITGRDGRSCGQGGAICLEPQRLPDSVNRPQFPSIILPTGEEYRHETCYRFYVR